MLIFQSDKYGREKKSHIPISPLPVVLKWEIEWLLDVDAVYERTIQEAG